MTRLIKCMICVVACLCALTAVAEADVPIDETTFPDDNFRAYVLERIDKDGDVVLSEGEIEGTTSIVVSDMDIADLTGIGCFADLKYLYCENNDLKTLDVSDCPLLRRLECRNNKITSLNIKGCSAIETLTCDNNRLSTLDVSHCSNLTGLDCADNLLTTLDVTKCKDLFALSCSKNRLTYVDVSECTKLNSLYCYDMQLTSLDVTRCADLEILNCSGNPLGFLDVRNCGKLRILECSFNALDSLDVSNCPQLSSFVCYGNNLTKLDVTGNIKLRDFSCFDNKLTSLNVTQCTNLEMLQTSGNPLQVLDVSKCTDLEMLFCENSKLTSIDVSECLYLKDLYCGYNKYPITVPSARTFNLSKLPGTFDVSRTSNWVGGTVSGNILTVDSGAKQVTYDYDAGNGYTANFTLNVTVDENMPVYCPGDADNNGSVNSADALTILHYCVSDDVTINTANADVNGDGTVSIHDALCIFQHEAGWDGVLR